jgi:hypothetical protein
VGPHFGICFKLHVRLRELWSGCQILGKYVQTLAQYSRKTRITRLHDVFCAQVILQELLDRIENLLPCCRLTGKQNFLNYWLAYRIMNLQTKNKFNILDYSGVRVSESNIIRIIFWICKQFKVWDLLSFEILSSVKWQILTDVSRQPSLNAWSLPVRPTVCPES